MQAEIYKTCQRAVFTFGNFVTPPSENWGLDIYICKQKHRQELARL